MKIFGKLDQDFGWVSSILAIFGQKSADLASKLAWVRSKILNELKLKILWETETEIHPFQCPVGDRISFHRRFRRRWVHQRCEIQPQHYRESGLGGHWGVHDGPRLPRISACRAGEFPPVACNEDICRLVEEDHWRISQNEKRQQRRRPGQ